MNFLSNTLEKMKDVSLSESQAWFDEREPHASPNSMDPKVLVIEDDRTTQHIVRAALEDVCHLALAPTADKGITWFENYQPDIVFLDLGLPDGDGHDLLKWMMKTSIHPYVVIMSSHSDHENFMRAIKTGARGFIPKPFNTERMVDFVESWAHPAS